MFGIKFMKANPTSYVLHYSDGKIKREGVGLSFFYYAPFSTIVSVPIASADLPYIFNEITSDFQSVTIQGQVTYRVGDAKQLAKLLDFSLAQNGQYRCEDPELLKQRLVGTAQISTKSVIQRLTLRDALVSSTSIVREVIEDLKNADSVKMLGVEIIGFSILSIRPTPEMARAMEAEAREAFQRKADEAIYARRNAAVEQERMIKESELNTEIAVEEKRRKIRETQMAAEIAIEEQRSQLIDQKVENDRKDTDSRAYALETTLAPLRNLDWKTLMAISNGAGDSRLMISLAFRELAENAQKIGELNITPDLLNTLLDSKDTRKK